MPRKPTQKGQIVIDYIRRYNHMQNLTLAKVINQDYPDIWNGDYEKIRGMIRDYRGQRGEANRQKLSKDHVDLLLKHPLKMPKTWRKNRLKYKLSPGLWLVLSDLHVPYHEPIAIEAAFQMGQAEKVDGIFINGDLMDAASIGYWDTTDRDFKRDVNTTIDFLDFTRQEFPEIPIVYKPGNHEYRLIALFMRNFPELATSPLAIWDTIMGFEMRNIEFLDYFQIVMAGKLSVLHGHEIKRLNTVVNPARGLFQKILTYGVVSHCHRTSHHEEVDLHDMNYPCWSFGCLSDLHPDWWPYANRWNWGFGLINVESDGNFEVVNRRILKNGKVV